MNVLVVTNMYPRPGSPWYGIFVERQVEALRRAGVGVDVELIEGHRGFGQYLAAPKRVARRLEGKRYDVVHAHHGYAVWAVLRAHPTRDTRPPLVVTVHDGDLFAPPGARVGLRRRLTRSLRLRAIGRADLRIVVNQDHLRDLDGVVCLPCGVDADEFRPEDREKACKDLGVVDDGTTKRLLFPADPSRVGKRFDLALSALEVFRSGGGEAELLPCTDVAPDRMPLHYNAADAVLMVSDYEASPMALKEALACERPVVSRRVGDAERVLAGIEGAELCGDSPEEIASAIESALERPSTKGGRQRLEELDMTSDHVTERLVGIYGGLSRT